MTTFASLDLIEPLLRALHEAGYTQPTPIQRQAIPPLLDDRDVIGCAQTGTGKTAAFALPTLQLLSDLPNTRKWRPIRALILSPTRELAAQIGESFQTYGKYLHLRSYVIFGGVSQVPQVAALRRGVDILVATPGRLLDLIGQGEVDLRDVESFVLDEADRMLDMGFIHDIRRILTLMHEDRQNMLFSATMPPPIVELAASFLVDPVRVEVTPQATTVARIEQQVHHVERSAKLPLLATLLRSREVERAIVFTRTKHGANNLVKQLERVGLAASAIHGNKSQNARTRALAAFREGAIPILVATDLAARGLDIDDISHVFNYDLPDEPESYVHRIGRTGRAGRSGIAVALCEPDDYVALREIERTIGASITVVSGNAPARGDAHPAPPRRTFQRGGNNRSAGSRGNSRPRRR